MKTEPDLDLKYQTGAPNVLGNLLKSKVYKPKNHFQNHIKVPIKPKKINVNNSNQNQSFFSILRTRTTLVQTHFMTIQSLNFIQTIQFIGQQMELLSIWMKGKEVGVWTLSGWEEAKSQGRVLLLMVSEEKWWPFCWRIWCTKDHQKQSKYKKVVAPQSTGGKKGEMENLGTLGHWYLVNQALMDGHHLPHWKDEN